MNTLPNGQHDDINTKKNLDTILHTKRLITTIHTRNGKALPCSGEGSRKTNSLSGHRPRRRIVDGSSHEKLAVIAKLKRHYYLALR